MDDSVIIDNVLRSTIMTGCVVPAVGSEAAHDVAVAAQLKERGVGAGIPHVDGAVVTCLRVLGKLATACPDGCHEVIG